MPNENMRLYPDRFWARTNRTNTFSDEQRLAIWSLRREHNIPLRYVAKLARCTKNAVGLITKKLDQKMPQATTTNRPARQMPLQSYQPDVQLSSRAETAVKIVTRRQVNREERSAVIAQYELDLRELTSKRDRIIEGLDIEHSQLNQELNSLVSKVSA